MSVFRTFFTANLELRIPRPSYNKIKTITNINEIDSKFMANDIKSKLDGI